jgi:Nif-specific regulatory protein
LRDIPDERVGGNVPIRVDVRVVSATNKPLEEAVREGELPAAICSTVLQVVEIRIPPLRDRKDDIRLLADHFLTRFAARETGRKSRGFSDAAYNKLAAYDWPGNVRELRNVVERAVALGSGPTLDAEDLWLSSLSFASASTTYKLLNSSLTHLKRWKSDISRGL